jgi:RNA polymerase sigma factor (sigma-70 family)
LSEELSLEAEGGGRTEAEQRIAAVIERYRGYIAEIVGKLAPRDLGVDRSDLEQETAVRLWRSLRNERDIRDYRSYVYRIAATVTMDAIRVVKSRMEESLIVEHVSGMSEHAALPGSRAASPEQSLIEKRLVAAIGEAVDALPTNRRRAVKLHLQGFGSQEIADLCGWTEAKARNLVYRALADVRAGLRKADIDGDE